MANKTKTQQPKKIGESETDSMLKLPRQELGVQLDADTLNEEKRTVDAVFYSGAQVMRMNWWTGEKWMLQFSMDPAHIRMGRLQSGAPLLNQHSDWSLSDVLGVVEKAWLEDGKGMTTLRFSDRADVEPIWQDVKNKIIRNVSMGAAVHKLKDVTPDESKIKHYLAIDWEPMEISAVPIGADPGAGFLKEDHQQFTDCVIEHSALRASAQEETLMKDEQPTGTTTSEPVNNPAPVVDLAAVRAEAAKAERLRCQDIRRRVKIAGLDEAFATQLIDDGVSAETASTKILDKLADNFEANPTRTAHAEVTRDEAETFRHGMIAALACRADQSRYRLKPEDNGYQFMGITQMGLLRVAEECLSAKGHRVRGLTPHALVELAISTSDLPNVLANTADKFLRAGYSTYQSKWNLIAARRSAPNFKTQNDLTFDMNSGFDQVNESGEFKYGSLTENKETWRILTYGKIIAITRQTIINDDLGAITRVPSQLGYKAAVKQADLVWAVLTANGNLADGAALFSTNHANYTSSGTAISDTSIGVGRTMLRVQTSLGGDYLNQEPVYLVVPPHKERLALQYTSTQYVAAQPSNINVYAGTLQVIAEPRLGPLGTETAWYLFASPAAPGSEVVIYAFLDGNEGVFSESRTGFNVDGIEVKARMDFGCGAIDYRGAYLNAGA